MDDTILILTAIISSVCGIIGAVYYRKNKSAQKRNEENKSEFSE